MLTDKSNITRLIKGTEKKGLVQKIRNKSDGRALSLYLTTRGEALLSDAAIAHKKFNENRFSMVHDDIDGLLSELKDVKNRLDKHLSS